MHSRFATTDEERMMGVEGKPEEMQANDKKKKSEIPGERNWRQRGMMREGDQTLQQEKEQKQRSAVIDPDLRLLLDLFTLEELVSDL